MRGSLRKLSNGSYELRVYLGTIDGRKRWKSRTWPRKVNGVRPRATKAGAEAALAEFVADVTAGRVTTGPTAGSVEELLEAWIRRKRRDWQPRTLDGNRRFVDRYLIPRCGDWQAARVRPRQLEELYEALAAEVGVPTARRAHVHLHAAYEVAIRQDRLLANPCARVEPPRARARTERDVSIGTVAHVIRHALEHDNLYMAVLVRVALATGARRGELIGLRWGDIDLDLAQVTIQRAVAAVGKDVHVKPTKTGKVTAVALDAGTVAALQAWRDHCNETYKQLGVKVRRDWYVFGRDGKTPMHPDALTGRWRKLCEAAGVQMRFHDIRHAAGSFLLTSGFGAAEIARRQGHSPRTFLEVYASADRAKDAPMALALGAAVDAQLTTEDFPTSPIDDG